MPTQRETILEYVKAQGPHGATTDEIQEKLGYAHQSATARLHELRHEGLVAYAEERRKSARGAMSSVYVATDAVPHQKKKKVRRPTKREMRLCRQQLDAVFALLERYGQRKPRELMILRSWIGALTEEGPTPAKEVSESEPKCDPPTENSAQGHEQGQGHG